MQVNSGNEQKILPALESRPESQYSVIAEVFLASAGAFWLALGLFLKLHEKSAQHVWVPSPVPEATWCPKEVRTQCY